MIASRRVFTRMTMMAAGGRVRGRVSREAASLHPHVVRRQQFSTQALDQAAADDDSTQTSETESSRRKIVKKKNKNHTFIPRKAPVNLTEKSRTFFKALLENASPSCAGIILRYHQSSSGEPRMVFSFDFVETDELTSKDEGVSLEVLADGSPKPPEESAEDGLPKLYVHQNAFMKVLGGTLDVNTDKLQPLLYDREGNVMDPNA